MGKIVKLKNANDVYTYPVTKTEAVYLDDNKTTLKDYLDAMAITKTAGPAQVVTFDDGADNVPVKSLILNIEPHQEGTGDPSPENIRPISGYTAVNVTRTGKNLIKSRTSTTTKSGITLTVNDDGSLTVNGTASADATFGLPVDVRTIDLPDTTQRYIVTGCPDGGSSATYRLVLYLYLDGVYTDVVRSEYGSGLTLDPTDGTFNQFRINVQVKSGQTVNNLTFKPMIRLASITDSTYEPYQGTTYSISLSSAGTIYGGTLDATNGELMVDTIKLAVSDDVKPAETNLGFAKGTNANRLAFPIKTALVPLQEGSLDVLCNIGYASAIINSGTTFAVGACSLYKGTACMYFRYGVPTSITTAADAYQYLQDNNCEFTVPLETPITYQLTPTEVSTLLGNNTIWMDADGTLQVTYKADLATYIANAISSLNS